LAVSAALIVHRLAEAEAQTGEASEFGRLIDAAGLKGFTIGGAQVSEKHANFVLNLGDATAKDIRAVIEAVMAKVEAVHGVKLHPEVEIAGAW
jgi:UDP-N-acetylmuramate dehydrogenase